MFLQVEERLMAWMLDWRGNLTARNHANVFFVGVGDQFDDDRRLVRGSEEVSAPAAK
jgi:hypothetical protein